MLVRSSSQSMLLPLLILHFAVAETSAPDVVAQFGGDVTLSCLFPSPSGMNLQRLTLTWQKERAGAEDLVVHSYYYGKEQLERQDEAYRNRTRLDPEGLAQGNASVTLRGVRIQDEGVYLCHITSEQGKISERRQVKVMAPYSEARLEVSVSSQLTLTCCAEGGYPEASVLWLDGAGNNVTAESDTRLQRDPRGLCDVSSRILLPRGESGNYTCLLESPGQPHIVRHLSVSCSPDNCTNNLCLLIALPMTVLLGVLGIAWCFLRRRFSRCSAANIV
ncbi:CD276 antigen-like isoform X1 [Trachemys scripta elegans]|uniref:CD276 antigen-like isoform X1 n=1 Tax=Trachemys scripta elegans TaxID=31138 RepID=UPI001552F5AF|nr:CD276 antigen-like isoform X1 [Trachemys scripta elegans]XP_034648874.1 CD276 antigen-like isoform X1 [Trachemys scripta elegans]XP_034648875.1 CD276 antigen-like isoform X1 [Trachemys scripta elegans]XP_034648876.1 CD276 antigen-like isoform X1 [Trachemys scripta elegans]XP_034648877.1 CD276 antigen-like isoform X1 [Trachemys scripta elegans]